MREGKRLFGTDGVRGVANVDLTPEFATELGRAAGELVQGSVVTIGRDTRRSGPMLAAAIKAGFNSLGTDTIDLGVLPTGGISHLTRMSSADFGVVISASHNPAPDNGIKFIGRDGSKLSDAMEDAIEARYRLGPPYPSATGEGVGTDFPMEDALSSYVEYLASESSYTLRGISLALDCANGAAYEAAPQVFERLHAEVEAFAADPDGTNINDGCGATNPSFLAARSAGRIGLAFDGDADRLIAIDEDGVPANGDVVMAIIARHLKEQGKLKGDQVVATVMANLGFRKAMHEAQIEIVETQVGDRYVLEAMREHEAILGGEQSGHIIFTETARTGDGLLTAIRLLEVIAGTGRELRELRQTAITEYPQVTRNVTVAEKEALDEAEVVWESVQAAAERLGDDGRVLVRASGTEPMVRVMVEAPTREDANAVAEELTAVIRSEMGQ
ncbi:MAG: phosphoglucosamine mutase [Acidimicrobiia bacterium]